MPIRTITCADSKDTTRMKYITSEVTTTGWCYQKPGLIQWSAALVIKLYMSGTLCQ